MSDRTSLGISHSRSPIARRSRAQVFRYPRLVLALSFAAAGIVLGAGADSEVVAGLHALPEVEFKALSQLDWNPLGARALAIRPQDWKHAETEHFIYHFFHSYVATPVSVEAEFHYRVIAQELDLTSLSWASRKIAHLHFRGAGRLEVVPGQSASRAVDRRHPLSPAVSLWSAIQATSLPTIR